MNVAGFRTRFEVPVIAVLMLTSFGASRALAQDDHSHGMTPAKHEQTPEQNRQAGALVQAVRDATRQFKDGPPENYVLTFGCVSGGDFGAMGMHFLNGSLLGDGDVKVETPEILLYEPLPNGRLRLTGADYLVDQAEWDSNPQHQGPPELMGQLFHLFDSPNRFGLKAFYTLHVWAWKDNPNGTFTNWNPDVSCDAFPGEPK
ncbi:MAG TPA: hypothetical protein VNZ26_32680 [Vicinamibacterales bacterium]|jgi:hypothetical protein|nr:hypothetical protein [Vicinamibacterales bacterium]